MGSIRSTGNNRRAYTGRHFYVGSTMTPRQHYRAGSNNRLNPDQNVCGQRVCIVLGVSDNVRYLHHESDIVRAIRTRFSVRSVKSAVRATTVGAARDKVAKINAVCFVCFVAGHVLLLDSTGKTIVDTAPRKRDRRRITAIYGVYPK